MSASSLALAANSAVGPASDALANETASTTGTPTAAAAAASAAVGAATLAGMAASQSISSAQKALVLGGTTSDATATSTDVKSINGAASALAPSQRRPHHRRGGSVDGGRGLSMSSFRSGSTSASGSGSGSSNPSSPEMVIMALPRRPRAQTLSSSATPLDLVHETDESSAGTVANPGSAMLRHSDPATRHLVSALTRRSKTLADAVARRRENRARSASVGAGSASSGSEEVTSSSAAASHAVLGDRQGRGMEGATPMKRAHTSSPTSPTGPPNIPLPPVPTYSPSRLRNSLVLAADPKHDRSPERTRSSTQAPSQRSGSGRTMSASSTPVNTPKSNVRALPVSGPSTTLPPLPDLPTALPTHTEPTRGDRDDDTVCQSSDEDLLEDELSQMEHSLSQFQATFAGPGSDGGQTVLALKTGPARDVRIVGGGKPSRFETPASTPVLPGDTFTASKSHGQGSLLEVPATSADVEESPSAGPARQPYRRSRDSSSTAASEFSGQALFEMRSRGNSTSTKASSVETQTAAPPTMARSLSQGSTLTTDGVRRKEAAIPPRRNSLFVATPPVRIASLENLRAAGADVVLQRAETDTIGHGAHGSLGLSMGPPAGVPVTHSQPQQQHRNDQAATPSQSQLLGSWLDDKVTGLRPARAVGNGFGGSLGWADEADSEDSDEQRFVPIPVCRRLHRRCNSMDSSIFSLRDDADVESLIDVEGPRPPTPPSHMQGDMGPTSLTPEHTPKSSPPVRQLLLPSESIIRASQARPSSSSGVTSRQPYAGLQARSQAKITSEGFLSYDAAIYSLPGSSNSSASRFGGSEAAHSYLGGPRQASQCLMGVLAPRHDSDNQSISSIAFSYAPTPPITPLRATAAQPGHGSAALSPLHQSADSPLQHGHAYSQTPGRSTAVFGRAGMGLSMGLATTTATPATLRSTNADSASDELRRMGTGSTMDEGRLGGRRSNAASITDLASDISRRPSATSGVSGTAASAARMGKLRTTIFDSFGIKKGKHVDDGMVMGGVGGAERPLSPAESASSHTHHGFDTPISIESGHSGGGVLHSLMRRTSVNSGNGGAAGQSAPGSSASSLSKARAQHAFSGGLSPASSPLKRVMRLPDMAAGGHSEPASASASLKRERLPTSDSQVSLQSTTAPPSSFRDPLSSKYSYRSGPSSVHGSVAGPSGTGVGSSASSISSRHLDRPTGSGGSIFSSSSKRHTTTQTSTDTGTSGSREDSQGGGASIRSGSSNGKSKGKKSSTGGSERVAKQPVRKEEVARVNAVLAELQSAGFMAPPKKKSSSSGGAGSSGKKSVKPGASSASASVRALTQF